MLIAIGQVDDEFVNPCGGVGWRTLSDGRIEIQGRGVLYPDDTVRRYVEQSWLNFGPEILAAAERRDVPPEWLLAIITVETGLWSSSRKKQSVIASDCCVGPMAIMVSPSPNYKTFGGYSSAQEMFEPAKNIDTGAAIVRFWMDKGYDLPMITARYNSGGLCCPTSPDVPSKPGGRQSNPYHLCSASIAGVSYPELAIMCNNYAVLLLGGTAATGLIAAGIVLAGLGVAAALWLVRRN
jgi:hypothetical protein